ncbi:MAG TPA: hydroxymethylbilane synthase [Lacipirellulaceae bacterium]|jgi:hydroxymethylbilane synthase|nr:hydroxymethylbilane synthase [Lacipirellulaceae bacterium]
MGNAAGNSRTLRLGTRGSQLARWQAEWVSAALQRLGHRVELIEIATHGDVDRARPIEEIGTRGVFTKAIQDALLAGRVDIAVHSLKDLPTEPVEGLTLAAVPKRESAADVLVFPRGMAENGRGSVEQLAPGARVGTGSLRRQAQLRHVRPDLQLSEVRGNLDTRLRKVDEGQFEAIVLAEAGLRRLGLTERIRHILPFDVMLSAVGQGALGIECRADDDNTLSAVRPLNDGSTYAAVIAERALLDRLRGGCMAPIGALAVVEQDMLKLQAVVLSADGSQRIGADALGEPAEADVLGQRVADELTKLGAAKLISSGRG